MKQKPAVVIDTNVLLVANGATQQASPKCVENCIQKLNQIRTNCITSLDSHGLILDEYFSNLGRSGQPKIGNAIVKWLHDNQYSKEHCEQVEITPMDDDARNFEEFPIDPNLAKFDPADRKFVAVAIASEYGPSVLQATDTKWWAFRSSLKSHGVHIDFLCPDLMTKT